MNKQIDEANKNNTHKTHTQKRKAKTKQNKNTNVKRNKNIQYKQTKQTRIKQQEQQKENKAVTKNNM